MALVTKIMMGLAILAGGAGIFLGMSIPEKVIELQSARDKYKKSSSDFQTQVGDKDAKLQESASALEDKDKKLTQLQDDLQSKSNELQAAKAKEQSAMAAKTAAEGQLQGAVDAKNAAEGQLQAAINAKTTAENSLQQVRSQLNNAGGAGAELKKYQNLKLNGKALSLTDLRALIAAEEKRTSAPPKQGKILKIVNANFGLYRINFGEKYTTVGKKYTVRNKANKLVGYISVVSIDGMESVVRLDKVNSPGVPAVGDLLK